MTELEIIALIKHWQDRWKTFATKDAHPKAYQYFMPRSDACTFLINEILKQNRKKPKDTAEGE